MIEAATLRNSTFQGHLDRPRQYLASISNREREVLRCIANGHTSDQIAQHLYISHHTVLSHRKNLLSKLGARNTAHLVSIGYLLGLMDS